jgi:hypothetical protein
MSLKTPFIFMIAATCFLLSAQDAPVEFEVASIRQSAPFQTTAAGRQVAGGVAVDQSQFRASSLTLRDYLSIAYGLPAARIEGPGWIVSERFDIQATIPPASRSARSSPKWSGGSWKIASVFERIRRKKNFRFGHSPFSGKES